MSHCRRTSPPEPAFAPGNYPPYIPEQDVNLTSGTPRSTMDGIHDVPEGRRQPLKPGELRDR
ncbi:MAG: hypothetical protein JWR32_3325 [Mycobacterium sp.]|jgi:hypothetical protein|nr:hypothetical protein [Mycobacterium sp.]